MKNMILCLICLAYVGLTLFFSYRRDETLRQIIGRDNAVFENRVVQMTPISLGDRVKVIHGPHEGTLGVIIEMNIPQITVAKLVKMGDRIPDDFHHPFKCDVGEIIRLIPEFPEDTK